MEIAFSTIKEIGSALGVPLAIVLCTIVMTLKQHNKRLDDGDKRMTRIEEKSATDEALLQEIRANVAYIRGKIDVGEIHK